MQKLSRQMLAVGGLVLFAVSAPAASAQQPVSLNVQSVQTAFNPGNVFTASINTAGFSPNNFDLFCIDELRFVTPPNVYDYYYFSSAAVQSLIVGTTLFSSSVITDQQLRATRLLLEDYVSNNSTTNSRVQGAIWATMGTNANAINTNEQTRSTNALTLAAGDASLGSNFALLIDKDHWDNFQSGDKTTGGLNNQAFMVREGDFVVVVPEPASLALVALGLAGLGITARRRRTSVRS